MTFSQLDLIRLHSGISGMTPKLMRNVLQDFAQRPDQLGDLFEQPSIDLQKRYSMKPEVADALTRSSSETAEQVLSKLQDKRFRTVSYLDPEYPNALLRFDEQMPPLLYIYGNATLFDRAGIGFGGSRNVSNQGLHLADQLARSVVKDRGMIVISGHAKGVDIIAHQSAIAAGGTTILVLPEGALCFRLHEALRAYWAEAAERIVIVTQFAPNEPWSTRNAMARNATAIGLSDAYCVIEPGDEEGGTWAAGVTTLKMGLPLIVVQPDSQASIQAGSTKLIAKGAIPLAYQADMKWPELPIPRVANPANSGQLTLF